MNKIKSINDLKSDSYCLRISDYGVGSCGPNNIETTLIFENKKQALDYLAEDLIPITLENIEDQKIKDKSFQFINSIKSLNKNHFLEKELDDFIDKFNNLFVANNEIKIEAYGELNKFFSSKYFKDLIKDLKEDFEEKEYEDFYKIISSKSFDSNNKDHLHLSKIVLEALEKN
jgi:hypothetical protein